ncbi:MAG TPA: acetyl-CoA carboxylase biotin carboxyl carrier protein [Ramlibacter sp.]|uniref:acetyl-CoA carboxylase biotin carboxyl carrier protein n=1 Tax=Ramlibacter sp. TaxID=1917967 RepID=UPI002B62ACC7|nr:acetyl-CoA carboxylase biotin carboxyl carrier protein [Ramlibacter sp.]HVZ42657.1 acetyl-CoA carboxylase biotin carboxyl carrier protein [Ramlibacter sp.]
MQLSQADVIEILRIVDSFGIGELRLEVGELRLHVVKGAPGVAATAGAAQASSPQLVPLAAPSMPVPARSEPEPHPRGAAVDAGLVAVNAPMVGTFYRAPAPGAAPFVEVGQRVRPDTPIGIVEVMKLMNTVNAGVAGTVREVRAADAQMVEYGQVLVVIEPEGAANA